ncbi:MAG TPA: hypothetical protein VN656_00685 [Stellaceae bacterium]|jgi:hypothetical protein|nr:hypothetical protein [Stellaceae bacterium]
MALQDAIKLLQAALEASVYVSPAEHGLTFRELYEVGSRLGLGEGEIGDALPRVVQQGFGGRNERLQLDDMHWHMAGHLVFREDPDLRNELAFDFVIAQLNQLAKQLGAARAQLDRAIIVERATVNSISRHDVELALSLMILSRLLVEKDGVVRFKHPQQGEHQLPSVARRQGAGPAHPKALRTRVMPHVKDVIARRTDNRPKHAEPLDEFGAQLSRVGAGHFGLWWQQTVAELRRSDPASSPLSLLVLSAALVEAVLTLAAAYAREHKLPDFATNELAGDPKGWTLEKLLKAAAHNNAVLDSQTKNRADGLILTRQRIHAGRLLSTQPKGLPIPDLRPEEAREAQAVAEQVVRFVIDWLDRNASATA